MLAVCEAGARLGCKEALFSLGDKPEARFPEHRDWLRRRATGRPWTWRRCVASRAIDETGLLPHANPGLEPSDDLRALRDWNVSVGIMLESATEPPRRAAAPTSWRRTSCPPTAPDDRRGGRAGIAFTTGILIGIGETPAERVDSLLAIRELHERYGHIQEVIVQNFRAKPDIPMAPAARADALDDLRGRRRGAPAAGPEHEHAGAAQPDAGRLPGSTCWPGSTTGAASRRSPSTTSTPRRLAHLARCAGQRGRGRRAARAPGLYPEYTVPSAAFVPVPLRDRLLTLIDTSGLVPETETAHADHLTASERRTTSSDAAMMDAFLARYWTSLDPRVRAALDRALDGGEVTVDEGWRWPRRPGAS